MRELVAELIGTFALVFCGTGAIVIDAVTGGQVGHLGISLTFGFIVTAVIYTYGPISGAHINPAVTIGFWISGRFPGRKVLPYCLVQFIGAILASFTLRLLFPGAETMGETLPWGAPVQTFILEIILTFFLMLVIIHVATGSKEQGTMAGLAIGLTVALEAAFAGPITGASMNPARSLGPALAAMNLSHLYIYLFAPVIGSTLAIGSWHLTRNRL